ncbi:TRAP transporter substrate-binding protein DctP [candidate division KSB1 bacterium]
MKIRTIIILLLISVLVFGNSYAQKKFEIKFASVAARNSSPDKAINDLSKELEELTNGRLKIKNYGNSRGDEMDIIKKMSPRLTSLHAAGLTGRGLGEILPSIRVLELPFLFKNYDEVDYVISKLYPRFSKEFENEGFVLLGWAEVGFVHIFSKNKISTPQDLKKAKMWTWQGDPLALEMFKALDVTPIPRSLPDALTQLQTPGLDAVYAHPYGALILSWHEPTNFINEMPITYATGAVVLQKKMFDEMDPGLQKILLDTSKKHLDALVVKTRKDSKEALVIMQEQGIEIVPAPNGDDLVFFEKAGMEVRAKLTGDLYPKELLDEVLSLLKDFRSK